MSCSLARWLYSLPAGALRVHAHAHFLLLFGAKTRGRLFFFGETFIVFIFCYRICFDKFFVLKCCLITMDSPGQRRGSCGHKMAGFDMHEKCARCRDKGLGKDPCIVGGVICKFCDSFTTIQREMLATPQYQIRKDKKAGLLVSP